MSDELTKPLGLQTARSRRYGPIWAFVLLLLVVGIAGAFVWTHQNLQVEQIARETPLEPPAAEKQAEKADGRQAASSKKNPATLQSPEPKGAIVELTPPPELRRQDSSQAHIPDPDLSERISSGIIPKRSPDNLRPMDLYSRQPATEGNFGVARVVLIVGGLGISQTGTQDAIRQLSPDVTLAFAPYGNSLSRWTQEARKSGHELLLQIPMEPIDYPANNPGQQTLLGNAAQIDNIANLHWLMSRITNYVGVINYLGGGYLPDPEALKPIFDELATRGLLFVDDGSIRNSRSDEAAADSLLPYAKAHFRLDMIRNRSKIAESLDELAEQAKRTGLAIGYANAFPESVAMIAAFVAEAGKNGIEITPVSAIVRDPEYD